MAKRKEADPIKAAARKSKAQRKVGVDARCHRCGEARAEALIAGRTPTICYQCDRQEKGRSAYENHHIGGQRNSNVTIQVPVNDHRAALSTGQYGWPKATLENRERSPLLAAAGCLRGTGDTIVYLASTFLEWIVVMLEVLDAYLRETRGAQWWRGTILEQWEPR